MDGDTHKYLVAKDTVNGFVAKVTKPDMTGKDYVSMFIPKVTDKNKFTIWGVDIQGTEVILNIYKSLVFKNSDTAKNPLLTNSKFIYAAYGNGETLSIKTAQVAIQLTKSTLAQH